MKRILFSGLLFTLMIITQSAFGQAENIIYGKKVVIKNRDTSSSELQIVNSTRAVPGYLKNIGSGLTRFVQPDYSELINKPTTFPPSSHTHGNPDITDLAWSKLTGVPDLVLLTRFIDSLSSLQGRINTKLSITDASATYITITRTIDSLARLQERIQTKEPLLAAGNTSQYYRGDKSWQTLDKTAVGLSNVPNTDATNASNISSGTLADARLSGNVTLQGNSFNAANQLVKLDGSGKLPTSTIPSLAITEPFVVASQAAMLALTAQTGDVAVRTDQQKTYILAAEPASTLANWVWLQSPDSESDPVYTASSWYSTTNNAGNWNTAYSWGNHASAGYAMASRTITINGTAYDLSANRSWTVGDVRTDGSYSNPSWITSLAWAKLTGVPSTFAPSSHTHPISDITSLQASLDAKLNLSGGTLTGPLSGTNAGFSGNGAFGTSSTSGSYRLILNGDASSVMGGIELRQSGTSTFYIGNPSASNTTDIELWNPRNGYVRFGANNAEGGRLTPAGHWLFGTNVSDGANRVQVSGGIYATGSIESNGLRIRGLVSNSPFSSSSWIQGPAGGGGVFLVNDAVTYHFGLRENGNVNAVASTYTFQGGAATFSDNVTAYTVTTTANYVYFGNTTHYIYRDSELGWYFTSLGYLKSAATYDADQNLLTTSNVTFNQVNATITGSVGEDMGTGGILSGTPRVLKFKIGSSYYYVTAYPIFSPPQP